MEEINYCLIFLHFSPCPINRYKKTILIWTKGFPIFSPSCHFHSTRLCCPCGFIVTPQLTETRWLLPGYGACFLCNNPLPFSTPFLDLWHYLFSINAHCFFLIMAISSFVSPQHLPSIADRVGQDWGIVVVSKCNYWHAPSTHTTMCAQICCWLHICKGKRKSSGRMEIIFKNHIVWQIFSTRKNRIFLWSSQSSSNHCTENHLPDQPDQWLVTFSHEMNLPLVQNNTCKIFTFGKQGEITLGIFS